MHVLDTMPRRHLAPVSAGSRARCRAGLLPLLVIVALAPAAAFAQDDIPPAQKQRARDLSVLEDLLSETIQDSINATVQAINKENEGAQETARQNGEPAELRYVFRTSGQTEARGMFLQDYGVIFTVQVPNVTFAPPTFVMGSSGTTWRLIPPNSIAAGALAEEYQMRATLSRLRTEISQVAQRLAAETQPSGGDVSESAHELQSVMDQLEQAYIAHAAETEAAEARQRSIQEDNPRQPASLSTTPSPGVRVLTFDAEDMTRAAQLANDQKSQIEGNIIETVIDTLAGYGSVIHDLHDDDRLAVVLLPSSYLSRIGSWARATKRAEEFIISVSYRDIEALDEGSIDIAEFGGRIRVEMRLGQPRVTSRQ